MHAEPNRVRDIFLAALECSPEQRPGYLAEACRGDAELRAEVDRLLVANANPDSILEPVSPTSTDATAALSASPFGTVDVPAGRSATHAFDRDTLSPTAIATGEHRPDGETEELDRPDPDATTAAASRAVAPHAARAARGDGIGTVVAGRYTLVEVIGEGGMGTVYLADQIAPVKRQVALKLIKIGMDSRAVLARFDAERQALALMDHPNIARVYDGGTTEGGQPFFVMELVRGEPITEYCDRLRLPIRARLQLFVSVCQAVQHAHQKGIIHRDLKPSNVMITEVDGRATPKVIDFGVAKATEFKLTDLSLGDTGAIVGTPMYMSPEQADPSSMDIDTRTDVYALGVILYELLVGSPPLDAKQFRRGAILEMLRMVREVDPPKPSTKVSTADALPSIAASRDVEPAHLKRSLQGDLDWIVMMALEKDRSRRYETANGFAADIQRHLAHEPVMAAPPSRAYQLQKFVRKHRGAVIAASLVLLALLGGLAAVAAVQTVANARLSASLARETKANNDLNSANAELTKSRAAVQARYDLATDAIKTFHTGVSEDFLLKEDNFKDLRNKLLKSAADFYGKLGSVLGKETDFASRRALGEANFELADLTDKVGRKENALATHRQVLAHRQSLAADSPADPEIRAEVGRSLTAIGSLLQSTGKTGEAEATYRHAESLLADLARSSPAASAARAALSACRSRLGYLLYRTGQSAAALEAYRLARADQEAPAAAPGASNEARTDLAATIGRIGDLLSDTGKPTEAEAEYRKAMGVFQRLADDNPAVVLFHGLLAVSHNNLGLLLSETGKPSEAEAEYREAMALKQKLADDNPAVTQFRSNLANSHMNLGLLLSETGKPSEAEAEYREAMALQQKLANDNPAVADFRQFLAMSHEYLGRLLYGTGKPSEAEAEYREATAVFQKLAGDNPAVTDFRNLLAMSHDNLGELLAGTGRPMEAKAEYRKAIGLHQRLVDDNPAVARFRSNLAGTQTSMADVLRKAGMRDEARAACDRARELREPLVREHPESADYSSRLAETLLRTGQVLKDAEDPAGATSAWRRAVALLDGLQSTSGERAFLRSCCHAGLAGLAVRAGSGVSPAEEQIESHQAINWVRRAVGLGYRSPDAYRNEAALDPIRDRHDFRLLMMDLAMPVEPFARAR